MPSDELNSYSHIPAEKTRIMVIAQTVVNILQPFRRASAIVNKAIS